jgi:sugar phosphate isomerase/epimerase
MPTRQIGAQCYTVRDFCKTPDDIARTCERLSKMGFGVIQGSAAGFNDIPADRLKQILDDNAMVCAATHRGFDALQDVQKQADWHHTVGCKLTAVGGYGFGGNPREEWVEWLNSYNQLAKQYQGTGLRLGYHNHSHEYSPFGLQDNPASISPDHTPMQLAVDTLDDAVWFEIDTYWVQHGGADPAEWITKCAGRIPAIHVKDITVTGKREHKICEVGSGNLNWPRILEAAKAAGVEYYLIERDNGDLDPFESLEISLKRLQDMGLS